VGRELGVEVVLEGRVRGADGRLRIATQLVRVSDGAYL
jgi:TolB-like protein